MENKVSSLSHTSETHNDNQNEHRDAEPPGGSRPRRGAVGPVADKYAGATNHVARVCWVHKNKCVVQEEEQDEEEIIKPGLLLS
uniref:Uncharacterized protein n=1 Tax=Brassica oleracea TaxID=3712 RepID=A0A3P6GGU7_BRAOL|nr:unnamed protein product [Brassica oleracea]